MFDCYKNMILSESLWGILFQLEGNILFAVLPYCILNCALLALVNLAGQDIGFSPTGHGLLTLLVSFLVISKVNLAYERYKLARECTGNAFLRLRELAQLIVTFSAGVPEDELKRIRKWRSEAIVKVIHILHWTQKIIQDDEAAKYIARHENSDSPRIVLLAENDPLHLCQPLRMHLYLSDHLGLQLLERVNLLAKLGEFVNEYRQLIYLASTPLPFALVQMGRAFLFLWTFSMPLVLRQGPFTDLLSAEIFLFFLTYGFIGLELVSMKLSEPFGDSIHDIRVLALKEATLLGIEKDLEEFDVSAKVYFAYDEKKDGYAADVAFDDSVAKTTDHDSVYVIYHAMNSVADLSHT